MSELSGNLRRTVYQFVRARTDPHIEGFQSYKRWKKSPSTTTTLMAKGGRARYTQTQKRRRRGFRRRRNYRGRALQPFKIVRNLKTVIYKSFDAGAGTLSGLTAQLNSLTDPFGDYSTQQPLGYDQYATLYERYCVIGGKIQVEATSADATNPLAVGVNVQLSATNLSEYDHYKELPHTVSRIMTPEQDKVTFGIGFGVKKFFRSKLLSDDRTSAALGANPTDIVWGHWYAQAVDKTANPGVVHMIITLTQTVVFYKPKIPVRSVQ